MHVRLSDANEGYLLTYLLDIRFHENSDRVLIHISFNMATETHG